MLSILTYDSGIHVINHMTPEYNHRRRIGRHKQVPLSPIRYTRYYVHMDELLFISIKLLTSLVSRHNRYPYNYQSNVYHIEYNKLNNREYSKNKTKYIDIKKL